MEKQPRVNHQIRISPIRLISADGEQLGVVSIEEARMLARERGQDLVEVAPNARPVVVKMMDFGKWKYEQSKNAREARKREHQIQVKQVKYRPFVDDNDFMIKTNRARRFLKEGNKVKITVMFRRRAMRRPENGYKIVQRVAAELSDVSKIEFRPSQIINRDLTMVLAPLAGTAGAKAAAPPKGKRERDSGPRPGGDFKGGRPPQGPAQRSAQGGNRPPQGGGNRGPQAGGNRPPQGGGGNRGPQGGGNRGPQQGGGGNRGPQQGGGNRPPQGGPRRASGGGNRGPQGGGQGGPRPARPQGQGQGNPPKSDG